LRRRLNEDFSFIWHIVRQDTRKNNANNLPNFNDKVSTTLQSIGKKLWEWHYYFLESCPIEKHNFTVLLKTNSVLCCISAIFYRTYSTLVNLAFLVHLIRRPFAESLIKNAPQNKKLLGPV